MRLRPISLILAITIIYISTVSVGAQDGPKSTTLSQIRDNTAGVTPTTAEVMRGRISKAKGYIAVKNFGAAIYELENIRKETNEPTVNRVLNVLLMHAYLEQGDYIKAQSFLKELQKNPAKALDYFAVAGQVVSGARAQLARYRALGVAVSDPTLPDEAKNDVDNMRKTLELVITQSKTIGKRKEMSDMALAAVEESSAARSNLARDAYDEKRWQNQVSEAREQIVTPRSKIISAVEGPVVVPDDTPDVTLVAKRVEEEKIKPPVVEEKKPEEKPVEAELKPVVDKEVVASNDASESQKDPKPVEKLKKEADKRVSGAMPTDRKVRVIRSAEKKPVDRPKSNEEQPNVKSTDQVNRKRPVESNVASNEASEGPVSIGSLIAYATRRVNPVYPRQAKSMRMQGTVEVEVVVDEMGKVASVENMSGPSLLKRAARDAVRKWKFKPFVRDGQPVKATGFVRFNFNL
ncbi:MAG: TonB family protein [Pyrinomonadaceae bacterium]|nr:TonB family protein [Pyrinomonadaceae bacterium]